MATNDQIPIYQHREARPNRHHHSARYYAHRVHESLTTRISKVICAIVLGLVFILGIVAFTLWLSLRPHRPRIHLVDFSVHGLDQANGFENAQIIFNVTARNSNQRIGFYYGSMVGSVFYKDQMIGSSPLLDPFYQEPKNTTVVYKELSGATLTVTSKRWTEFMNDRSQGTVVFRLDISSTIRFKVSTWDSQRHRMHANCDVAVGPDGTILPTYKSKRCPVYFT